MDTNLNFVIFCVEVVDVNQDEAKAQTDLIHREIYFLPSVIMLMHHVGAASKVRELTQWSRVKERTDPKL